MTDDWWAEAPLYATTELPAIKPEPPVMREFNPADPLLATWNGFATAAITVWADALLPLTRCFQTETE